VYTQTHTPTPTHSDCLSTSSSMLGKQLLRVSRSRSYMWSIRGRASNFQLAVQFSVCCLLRLVLVLLLLFLFFFFLSFFFFFLFCFFFSFSSPSLFLHRYILLSVCPILPFGLCCGCLLWVLYSLTHSSSLLTYIQIHRYRSTDTIGLQLRLQHMPAPDSATDFSSILVQQYG